MMILPIIYYHKMLTFVYLLVSLAFFTVKCTTEQRGTGRHIVVLRDDIDKQHLETLISDIREADEDPSLPDVHCTIHSVVDTISKILVVTASKGALDKFSKMKEVSFIEEDKMVEGAMNPYLSWALDRLDQQFLPYDQRYQPTSSGAGVDVYVVDGGIHYAHSEFEGRALFGGFDKVAGEITPRNGTDCNGHGTHIASIIGGRTFGVAKQVKLYSIRVLGCNNYGSSGDLVSALDWIAKRITQTKNPSVINLSLSAPHSMPLNKALKALHDIGVPIVAAAGNQKDDACKYSPASSEMVLTVAATTVDDSPYFIPMGPGTNFGRCVDVFAPGYYILGASLECNSCCRTRSGTSMATAVVTGAVALYLEKQPFLTAQQIYKKLVNDATNGAVKMTVSGVPVKLLNDTATKLVKVDGGCGGDFVYKSQGRLSSPNFPLNYSDNLFCTWRIIGRVGEEVKVVVEEISLQQNDTLTIIDGNSSLLAKLTGNTGEIRRRKFRSQSNMMTIILVTDDKRNSKGFQLKYKKTLAGENTLAKPSRAPWTPTPVPLPTSQPVTEIYDSKAFLQVAAKNVRQLIEEWENKKYYLKHIQASQFLTSNGILQSAYNIVFSNLSLDESYCVFEVNSTELLQDYHKSRRHYVPTEITQVIHKNELLYSTIFTRKNDRTKKHVAYWNDSLSQHEVRMKRMKRRGYVLKAQSFTYYTDHYYISSIYVEMTRDWFVEYNLTADESLVRKKDNRNAYVMTSISAYLLDGSTKFAMIFEAINHPDYTLWTIWDRSAKFTREVIQNYTAPSDSYEVTAVVGYHSNLYNTHSIRYIFTLGLRTNYYD